MAIQSVADTLTKLTQMGDLTLFEPAGDQPQREKPAALSDPSNLEPFQSRSLAECIAHVSTPKGPKAVLKTMITTACERNCFYCPFRAGRSKMERVTFSPEAIAGAFDMMQAKGAVDGMFLSSGIIKGSITTQDKIIDAVEIVRKRYHYQGYIHLKIMPGAEYDQLYRAMQLADRVSVNLEGPTQQRLEALAPKKDFLKELLQMLQWAQDIRAAHPHQKLASTVTQFVVGAVGETDLELLSLSEKLYTQLHLARAYYSTFHPIEQTPFENLPSGDALRELRLYQASFLLRDYGWSTEELPFIGAGNLRTDIDPKQAWADDHLRHQPIELMTADRSQLMRVPGIGKVGAAAILKARRQARLMDISQLRQLGIRNVEKAAPYILMSGLSPVRQMKLF